MPVIQMVTVNDLVLGYTLLKRYVVIAPTFTNVEY